MRRWLTVVRIGVALPVFYLLSLISLAIRAIEYAGSFTSSSSDIAAAARASSPSGIEDPSATGVGLSPPPGVARAAAAAYASARCRCEPSIASCSGLPSPRAFTPCVSNSRIQRSRCRVASLAALRAPTGRALSLRDEPVLTVLRGRTSRSPASVLRRGTPATPKRVSSMFLRIPRSSSLRLLPRTRRPRSAVSARLRLRWRSSFAGALECRVAFGTAVLHSRR